MKAIEMEINTKIQDEDGNVGVVIGNQLKDGPEIIAIEWEEGGLGKVNVNDVNLYKDLEAEFGDTASQINRKIREATKALREVNRLREEANLPALFNSQWLRDEGDCYLAQKLEMIDVSDLETEINSAGWSTSSSYC